MWLIWKLISKCNKNIFQDSLIEKCYINGFLTYARQYDYYPSQLKKIVLGTEQAISKYF